MSIERTIVQAPEQEDSGYVLPSPPRPQGELLVTEDPSGVSPLHSAAAARAIGARFAAQADSLDLFLTEVRERLERLDVSIAEDARARLKGAVRELLHVVDWCDAVQQDLAVESAHAIAGREPVDLAEVCREQAAAMQEPQAPITVVQHGDVRCWADRIAANRAIAAALHLVHARTRGVGARHVEVDSAEGAAILRVRSQGEPVQEIPEDVVDRFRNAVARIGARVVPDGQGPGGAGLVLRIEA